MHKEEELKELFEAFGVADMSDRFEDANEMSEESIKATLSDGTQLALPNISFKAFEQSRMFKSGLSDIEYKKYLMDNEFTELDEISQDSTEGMELTFKYHSGRVLKFKLVSDIEE